MDNKEERESLPLPRRRNRAYTTQTQAIRDTKDKDSLASSKPSHSRHSRVPSAVVPSKQRPANISCITDAKAINNNKPDSTHNTSASIITTSGRTPHQDSRQRPATSPQSASPVTTPSYHRRQSSSPYTLTSPPLPSPSLSSGYFSPQATHSAADPRSPSLNSRRPPASHSSHGIETTRGPPIALITRGSYSADIARHIDGKKQKPGDYGLAAQQLSQLGLISPGGTPKKKHERNGSVAESPRPANTSRQNSISLDRGTITQEEAGTPGRMDSDDVLSSSLDESSGNEIARRRREAIESNNGRRRQNTSTGEDADQTQLSEDLFLNIAEDSPKEVKSESKSRIARANARKSLPVNSLTSPRVRSETQTDKSADLTARILTHQRRASGLPSPSHSQRIPVRQQSPVSGSSIDQRSRYSSTGPGSSRDGPAESSPSVQYQARRRPSIGEHNGISHTRASTYKRSNLHHSSALKSDEESVHIDTPQAEISQPEYFASEEMESLDSGPAPSTVWDELDDLKSRIRKIEIMKNLPPTSAAAMSNTSTNDRPRTATTTVTTVSSSPKQRRKMSTPSDGVPPLPTANLHPMLHRALAKCKDTLSPAIYRTLEASANEALELCAMTGNMPKGATFMAASLVNGENERAVRRKADNLCRTLTELCISLCDGKASPASPAFHHLSEGSRRGSFSAANGDARNTPTYANNVASHGRSPSVEPEAAGIVRSPSRALSRIEARRSSLHYNSSDRLARQGSEEPMTPASARFARAGSSLLSSRHSIRDRSADRYDDEEDDTLRAPSRAMTEYSHLRQQSAYTAPQQRFSREYTSQEPMPQTSPLNHTAALRRPANLDRQPTITTRNFQEHQPTRERTPLSSTFDRGELPSRAENRERASGYADDLRRRQTITQATSTSSRFELPHERGGSTSGASGLSRTGSLGSRRMMAAATNQRERRFGTQAEAQ